MNDSKESVTYSEKSVAIVATVQVYIAAVEIVFSQLTFIQRDLGKNTQRDMVELRAFILCNKRLGR